MSSLETSIFNTLIYSDIFDYPLSKDEIWQYLLIDPKSKKSSKKIDKKIFDQAFKEIARKFPYEDNWFYLPGREEIIKLRKEKIIESNKKFNIVQRAVWYLSFIPTVLFIGISGALAMKNSVKNDDIDFFVITKRNSLWITRLMLLVVLEMLGLRRKRKDQLVVNKICLNMILDETRLQFAQRDIYTAHEITQLKPVLNRDKTYEAFIQENTWIFDVLPNALIVRVLQTPSSFLSNIIAVVLTIFENLAKKIQFWHMKDYLANEIVSDTFVAFHPFNYRVYVLKEYYLRLKQYESL